MPSERDQTYRSFVIVARAVRGGGRAVARRGDITFADERGVDPDDAITNVKAAVDERLAIEHAQRISGVPSVPEFKRALQATLSHIPPAYWAMLTAHYRAPKRTLTAGELADAAGYASYNAANLHYGQLARMLADHLEYRPDAVDSTSEPSAWTFTIAYAGPRSAEGHFTWVLRSEVVGALDALNVQ